METHRPLLILIRSRAPAAALRSLLDECGGPAAALAAGPRRWRAAGCRDPHVAALLSPDTARIDDDLAWLSGPDRHLVGWQQPDYPALLRASPSPPAALFIAGDPQLPWYPQVALVGTRHPSPAGAELAREFATAFAGSGLVVTSGLAEGVDAAAHRGALASGKTVAVIGCGADRAYPASHRGLMAEIAAEGAVVSEHPPGTAPLRQHFPARNRLIAGLSLGTVVIEAAERSGALITARLAAEAGREVFALPGSVRNPMARGCHRLIREGVALVETPVEVLEALRPVAAALAQQLRHRLGDTVLPTLAPPIASDGAHGRLWEALGHDPVGLDLLLSRTGLTLPALSAMLLALELDGRVGQCNGRYQRLGS